MIFAIELKKCAVSTGILDIVIGKLRHKKKPCPIIPLKVDKGLEIGFHHTILFFSLAVRLRVEGGKKSLLDTKKIA